MSDIRDTAPLPSAPSSDLGWMEMQHFLSTKEFAGRLRVSERTVHRAVASGRLRGIRLSHQGAIRIPLSELTRLLVERDPTGELE
jgi:excisionase family DNA binding protein